MIKVPLNLRPGSVDVLPTAGWFIPGGDSAAWLTEIERWELPVSTLRFYILPAGTANLSPAGVLVVPIGDALPRRVLRAQPYGRLARKLYLPIDAVLWPPVSDEELREQLHLSTLILHPSIGLVGFGDDDALRAHDLLAAPQVREMDWGRAMAGDSAAPRIRSVEPLYPPELNQMFEHGRGDIGSQAPQSLPRDSDEPLVREVVRKVVVAPSLGAARAMMAPLKLLAWLSAKVGRRRLSPPPASQASQRPGSAAAPGSGTPAAFARGQGWAQRLYANLATRLDRLSGKLLDQRQRSLERLQKMLEEDPDEGLRHAISLREVRGRGLAAPSASLPTRDLQFSLSSAMGGGGRPFDAWDMPPDTVQVLTRQYREAANRELRLGRYQRAAYIYAELLGDYTAAANALEQGGHFREAAALYRQKLNNPQRSAICLEAGGLLVEAATAYLALKQFEHAGDLYARIEQPEEAARCFQLAVDQAIARQELLAAAKLLETKLEAPDTALQLLTDAWPASPAAGPCLKASFDLLGRLGRHDEAQARITALAGSPVPRGKEVALMEAMGDIATGYTEQRVRIRSADAARVVAGRLLPTASAGDARSIAQQVRRLVPEDRLLGRDVTRYLARPEAAASTSPDIRIRSVVVVRQSRLPGDVTWVDVQGFDGGYCAVGWMPDDRAFLAGVLWSGGRTTAQWLQKPRHFGFDELKLHAVPGQRRLIAAIPFDPGSSAFLNWMSVAYSETALSVSRPSWLPDAATTIAINERGVVWELADDEVQNLPDPVLTAYNADDGHLLSSHSLPNIGWPEASVWHPAMLAIQDIVYAAWGRGVLRFIPITETRIDAMPSVVTGLIASPGLHDRKVVAVMEQGCSLLAHRGRDTPFAQNLSNPIAAFLRSGKVVVIDGQRGQIYDLKDGREPHRLHDFTVAGERPFKVIATEQPDQFATMSSSGQVTIYQAPA